MGMNRPLMIVVGAGLLLLQGCLLPVPFKTMHSATYRGKVLDAETREPLAKARVELSSYAELNDKAKTDERGEFEVGPLSCWSWIGKGWPYYEGRYCRHEYRRGAANMLPLMVSREGYETNQIFVSRRAGIGLEFVEDILLRPGEKK